MKKYFVILGCFLWTLDVSSTPTPPSPGAKGPPGPPGTPIDDNLYVLLIVAVIFGIYIIYNHKLKTKTPI